MRSRYLSRYLTAVAPVQWFVVLHHHHTDKHHHADKLQPQLVPLPLRHEPHIIDGHTTSRPAIYPVTVDHYTRRRLFLPSPASAASSAAAARFRAEPIRCSAVILLLLPATQLRPLYPEHTTHIQTRRVHFLPLPLSRVSSSCPFPRSMSGVGQHRSSGADPGVTPSRPPPASRDDTATAATSAAAPDDNRSYNFYTHPSRVSILDGNGDLTIDPTAFLLCSSEHDSPASPAAMDDAADTVAAWRSAGNLPSFSRAFDLFTNGDPDDASDDGEDRFFIPSYLQWSTYMHKLRDAHRSRAHSRRDQKRNGTMSAATNGFSSDLMPTGSHRGLSHTVVERGTPSEDIGGLSPLPTRWNKADMSGGLDLHTDGLGVKYIEIKGHLDRDHEACGIRADHHMPLQCGIYYFEVQILSGRRDECVPPCRLIC